MQDFFCDDSRFTEAGAGKDELEAAGGDGLGLRGIEGHLWRFCTGWGIMVVGKSIDYFFNRVVRYAMFRWWVRRNQERIVVLSSA
jgi:hypothetical protein